MTNKNVVQLPFIRREQVIDSIRHIAANDTIRLITLDHAAMRMLERDITSRQVLNVLKNGDVVSDITWETDVEKGWSCTFRGIAAGVSVTVATKLVERDDVVCLVITAY